jgi:hypothetical protein
MHQGVLTGKGAPGLVIFRDLGFTSGPRVSSTVISSAVGPSANADDPTESRNLLFADASVQFNWRTTVPKKVQINFAPKTPAELAKRLGVSQARLNRLLAIADGDNPRKHAKRSGRAAVKSKNKLSS